MPVEQTILEFGQNGEKIKHTKYTYEYDSTTGERIGGTRTDLLNDITVDTKQEAIDNIKTMYASTATEDLLRKEESEKLNRFIDDGVIKKLKDSGVNSQELETLLNELFPTLKGNSDLAEIQGGIVVNMVTADIENPLSLLKQLYNSYGAEAPFLTETGALACDLIAQNKNKCPKGPALTLEQRQQQNQIRRELHSLNLPPYLETLVWKDIQTQTPVTKKHL